MTSAIDNVGNKTGLGTVFLDMLKSELWVWIDAHQDQSVFTISLLHVIRKTFYVRDLTEAFILILGPKPQ